ncbi:MAG: cytochrome c nitrite reductase small subunit [Planctomycetales bacterium]|nr:cytochrome c nitrite reductase small subunit [Planctomycetales bacterium]
MPSPATRSFRTLLPAAALGVFGGASGYTAYYAEAAAYLSEDPGACVNCHVMREHHDGWQKASHHAAATCNDCHVPHALVPKLVAKGENGLRHSWGFTFQDFHEPIRIREGNRRRLNANCAHCHGELAADILHAGESDCVRCHASVGHGPPR